MKKVIGLLLLFFVLKVNAQKSVIFKMQYLPDRNYDAVISMDFNCKAALSGDEKILDILKEGRAKLS